MLVDKDDVDNWDEQLPIAVAAYNATEHATTKYTPNKLWFGREIPHHFSRLLPDVDRNLDQSWDDYVRTLDQATQSAYDAARQAIGKAIKVQKRYYDRKQNLTQYSTGDAVLIKDHSHHERGEAKFADKYSGPYFIIDVLSDIHFRIAKHRDDRPRIIHHDNIKKMHLREPVDLKWVFELSRYHNTRSAPTTLEDMGNSMTELMRRLKAVENQVGDFSRSTGRKRTQRKPRVKKTEDERTIQPQVPTSEEQTTGRAPTRQIAPASARQRTRKRLRSPTEDAASTPPATKRKVMPGKAKKNINKQQAERRQPSVPPPASNVHAPLRRSTRPRKPKQL